MVDRPVPKKILPLPASPSNAGRLPRVAYREAPASSHAASESKARPSDADPKCSGADGASSKSVSTKITDFHLVDMRNDDLDRRFRRLDNSEKK
jgi:hypothetical protein